jgi:hypothetical protein
MAYATLDDLLLVEPTIQEYGNLDWDAELARSETEVNRVLQVRWFLAYKSSQANANLVFDPALLTPSQWTQATVYHALAYHIAPKLTKFEQAGNEDKFQVMMTYYSQRFEHEMDLSLRLGVEYDADDNNTISQQEKQSLQSLKLVR